MFKIPGTIQNIIQLTPEQTSMLIGAGNKLTNLKEYGTKQIALKLLGVISDGLFDTDYLAVAMLYPDKKKNEYYIDVRDFEDSKSYQIPVVPDGKFDKKLQKVLSRLNYKTKVIGAIIQDDQNKIDNETKERFIRVLNQTVSADTSEAHLMAHLTTHFQRAGFSLSDTPSTLTISNYSGREVVIRVINGSLYIDKYNHDNRKDISRIKGPTSIAQIMKEVFDFFKYVPYNEFNELMEKIANTPEVKDSMSAFSFFPYEPKTNKIYVLHNELNVGRRVDLDINIISPLMEAFNYINNPKSFSVPEPVIEKTINMKSAKGFVSSAKDILETVFSTDKISIKGSVITIKYTDDITILINKTAKGMTWSHQEKEKPRSRSKLLLDKSVQWTIPQVEQKLVSEIVKRIKKLQDKKNFEHIALLTIIANVLKEKYEAVSVAEETKQLSFRNDDNSVITISIDGEMLMWQVSKKINDDRTIQTGKYNVVSIEEMKQAKAEDIEEIIFNHIIQQLETVVLETTNNA